jgi:exopolysaccharide biosynthesis polyprenyl glycosylphosphotransferase
MEQQAVDVSGRAIAVGAARAGGRLRPIHLSLVRADGSARRTARPTVFESFRTFDLALGVTALLLVHALAQPGGPASAMSLAATTFTLREVLLIVAGAAAWPVMFGLFGLYAAERARTPADEAVGVLVGTALALAVGMTLVVVLSPAGTAEARYGLLALLWPVFGAAGLGGRWLRRSVRRARRPRRVLIVGSGPRAYRLSRRLEAHADGAAEVVGFVDDPHDGAPDEIRHRVRGPLSELARVVVTSDADEVFIALPFRSLHAESGRVVALCARMGVPCRYLVDGPAAVRSGAQHEPTGIASMRLELQASTQWSVAKRATDVVGALLGLVVLAPLFVAIALAIRLTSRGPIFFLQERFGLGRRTFRMVKFRTMRADAEALLPQLEALNEANGPIFKIRHDPRVTPVGRFLRRWSLDELPQLVNVLFGDMTLVGPRPMSRRDVHRLEAPEALRRFTVTPGLTGLWQVSSRDSLDFEEWVEHDLDYIDRWSPRLELGILARTLPTVLRGVGSV